MKKSKSSHTIHDPVRQIVARHQPRLVNARILTGDPHFKNIKEAIMMTNNPKATKPASRSSGYETKPSKTPKTYPHHKPQPKK